MKLAFISNYNHSNQGHVMVCTKHTYLQACIYFAEFGWVCALFYPTVNVHVSTAVMSCDTHNKVGHRLTEQSNPRWISGFPGRIKTLYKLLCKLETKEENKIVSKCKTIIIPKFVLLHSRVAHIENWKGSKKVRQLLTRLGWRLLDFGSKPSINIWADPSRFH